MNRFIGAIKNLDLETVRACVEKNPKWPEWKETSGKNALHFLGGVEIRRFPEKEIESLEILKFLLRRGMDIDSVHRIEEKCGFFPATPLWYAYTRGRNHTLYTYLLEHGANPDNCMFAIAWYDDPAAATLFKNHGAKNTDKESRDTPFMAAFEWKKWEMTRWFLQNGADVDFIDEKGNTALFYAVSKKAKYGPEHVRMLLEYGANPDKLNGNGMSPRSFAEENRRRSILKLFDESEVKLANSD